MRGVGSHRHSGEPVPLDAGWEVGLGRQVRGRKGVCGGEEEGRTGATVLFSPRLTVLETSTVSWYQLHSGHWLW